MRLQPQRAGGSGRIDIGLPPPCGFIAIAMDLTVVSAAQRHSELIADLAAKGSALGKAEMVGIGGMAAADQARVLSHLYDVLPVPNPTGLRKGQGSLVDPSGPRIDCPIPSVLGARAGRIARSRAGDRSGAAPQGVPGPLGWRLDVGRLIGHPCLVRRASKARQLDLEGVFDAPGI